MGKRKKKKKKKKKKSDHGDTETRRICKKNNVINR